ncbi:hypothetical protein ABLB69_06390 [Xenorhabdus khoisanae]|uniref:Uncharacterized protein n=1 Tax=Xenorhabdus khoisanae TaxID=880157 RepID=A0A0J5IRR6_9GAMM|nr:hypothetical protein [Xenorhabdus khoisanae]KMJ45905.1 hypothetical protein AB204_06410 [Xenorhabdus khoisanae]
MKLNKKNYLFLMPFLLGVSHFSVADKAIENLITKNGLKDTKVMSLYKNGTLVVEANTPNKVTLINKKAAKANKEAKDAMYWYRGMGSNEYKVFDANKYRKLPCVTEENAFCGIAPRFDYSKGYLTNKNPGVVIEFSTIEPKWLYHDFTKLHKCQPKAEGGGTYGLGPIGTFASCDDAYKQKGMGKVFNKWLEKPEKIDVIISYVLLAK